MGSPLLRTISALSEAGYGVNILEQTPPGAVTGVSTSIVGIVGDFPWGEQNVVTTITSTAEFFDAFAPGAFNANDSYPALRALLNKTYPGGLRVVRIAATGAAAASETFQDLTPVDSVDVTANHPGAIGNSITIEWVANTATPANRDAIVRIGTTYVKTYENVVTAVPLAVVDPGDPYVTFSENVAFVAVPDPAAAAPLTSGSDGTAVAGDYTGSITDDFGIRKFYSDSVDVDVLFVAECPSALADTVNTALAAYGTDTGKGMAIGSTVTGQTKALAKLYVAANSLAEDNMVYAWPQVRTVNGYDPLRATITVDGNSFVAAAVASVPPEKSPGGGPGAPFLKGIVGLADDSGSQLDYDELNAAGVAGIVITRSLGPIIRKGVTTDITSGKEQIFRRRMTDYIQESIAGRAEIYVGEPLDLVLLTQDLGTTTGAFIGEVEAFLGGLKAAKRIQDYSVDAFSQNLQANLDAGEWRISIAVKLYAAADAIVLMTNIGTGVVITEIA